jgi:hypothetical protein
VFAYKNMNSASNMFAYYLLFQKQTNVLNFLKKGMQVAGITSSDLQPSNIGDGNCSIM